MEIPELTATQLSIITETVNGTGAYSQMDPDRDLDTTEDYANWMRGVDNTNALVSLGFLEDITDKCQEALGVFVAEEDAAQARANAMKKFGKERLQ